MANSHELPNLDGLDIEAIDRKRDEYGLSKQEFARRADKDEDRWHDILRRDIDPRLSTIKDFIKVLHDADPDGPRTKRGRAPSCQIRSDGGKRGGEQ